MSRVRRPPRSRAVAEAYAQAFSRRRRPWCDRLPGAYPPNLAALDVFADELLPRLEHRGLECHVLAVGREPPRSSPHPRIHLAGSVERVAPWLKAADLAVVPLCEGGGTRMKIIDYFAAGLPVVSTSKGIEGIEAANGVHAMVADSWDDMCDAIADLVGHPGRAADIAAAGRRLADQLDWRNITRRYLDLFSRL